LAGKPSLKSSRRRAGGESPGDDRDIPRAAPVVVIVTRSLMIQRHSLDRLVQTVADVEATCDFYAGVPARSTGY
jgi:hypothetical protein